MMDSANGTYMQYNNNNSDDITSFFNDVEHYAANSLDNNTSTQFDPALFSENSLGSFHHQPNQNNQATQPTIPQSQRPSQTHSPALPQFRPNSNVYNGGQYGQSLYGQQPLQPFDSHLLSRPSPSPGPYDQYAYQSQQMNYGQPNFDYRFNSFQAQGQTPTPTQPFRPQVSQSGQQYLTGSGHSPQPPSLGPQPQTGNSNGMYPYQGSHQTTQHFVEPSMLKNDSRTQQTATQISQVRPIDTTPYFPMTNKPTNPVNSTLDPRALQMQQFAQQHQAPVHQANTTQQYQPFPGVQLHPVYQQNPHVALMPAVKPTTNAKPRKDGKYSGSASSSDDDLDIEEEPEAKPAAITIAKPSDERGKLLWEVVDAVWTPRNKPAAPEKIRSAISFIGTAVRNLRDKWKAANDQLKQAELPGSKNKSHVEPMKTFVSAHRETMESLAGRVARLGHPSILSRLGEHQVLLSALYSFLLDRVTAGDFNSTLVVNILQLGTKLIMLDEEQLEKVKWKKILDRFISKATNESKILAQQILENAKKATARKKADAVGQGPASPSGSVTGQIVGVKRPREGSEPTQQVKKSTVKPSSKPLSVQLAEQRKLKEKERSASTRDVKPEKTINSGTNGTALSRPKATSVPSIKPSPFAGLMSASKRPGTTLAERATKDKIEIVKPVVTTTKRPVVSKSDPPTSNASANAPQASSFMGFLVDMDKPKEQPKVKVVVDPNETIEVRDRRLRKEKRRELRVKWKPEGELVQTRIFEHDPDEEKGHDDSMMLDVGDTGKEGEMLKQAKHMQETDDDSDDEFDFFPPSDVDFSGVNEDSPENFTKCGGLRSPESKASELQIQHESGNIMTVFAAGEQPTSPQEPPEGEDDDFNPVVDFGEPTDNVVNVRIREQNVYAKRQAYQQQQQGLGQGFNLSAALARMNTPHNVQQDVQTTQQAEWLRALGVNVQQQQAQGQVQQTVQQNLDLSQLMALVGQAQQQQQQQQQNVFQAPISTHPGMMTSAFNTNPAVITGQLQQGGVGLPIGVGENPNPYPGDLYRDKRDKKDNKPNKKGKSGAPIGPNGLPLNYKTKICQFWLQNKCEKGDSCTFRHDHEGTDA